MDENKKYAFTGRFKARSGQADALTEILLEASRKISSAKGILLYSICRDPKDADFVYVMEIWDSKADHDQSLTLPETRALIGKAMPLIDGKPEGTSLEVVGGFGV